MKLKLATIFSILKSKKFAPMTALAVVDLILLMAFLYIGFNLFTIYNQVTAVEDSIKIDEQTMKLVKENTDVFGSQIDSYNSALNLLIPDDEGYFTVISALEALSAKSGVLIDSYSIDLESTTQEKLSLNVTLNASSEQLTKFISDYPYITGRLIVNEGLSYDPSNPTSLEFSLNLYHKSVPADNSGTSTSNVPKIDKNDIQLIQGIIDWQLAN